jgi:hypothetical protein
MAGERDGEHLVALLEAAEHQLPGAPGVAEAVQQEQRLAAAATVRLRESPLHMWNVSDKGLVAIDTKW